ncbi:hypothetical protein P5673_011827 [Acropora cervicornis]|uniref:Uncharacterized protein n=1 Tax=Acropora cervicornis TaxID=6130 RepID=A0AAD9QNH7_ACRCE|nr:hypothetical protein P5673_011827 [Acropora cervicornis]
MQSKNSNTKIVKAEYYKKSEELLYSCIVKINVQTLRQINENHTEQLQTSFIHRNKSGRMSGTNTRSAMLNWLVCDGELAKIMPNHLWLQ